MSLATINAYRDELDDEQIKRLAAYSASSSTRATKAAKARATSGKRRGIDPCTSEIQYSDAQREFILAMYDYIRRSGRKFPTHSEYLEVLISLGYHK